MNWDMVAAVAELVGAVAVVVSLVYLGRQVREGTAQAKVQSYALTMARTDEWTSALGRDPVAAELYGRGVQLGFEGLDQAERVQFIMLVLSVLRIIEVAFNHREQGVYPEWADPAIDATMVDLSGTRGFQDFWKLRGHQFTEPFRSYVQSLDPDAAQQVHGQVGPTSQDER